MTDDVATAVLVEKLAVPIIQACDRWSRNVGPSEAIFIAKAVLAALAAENVACIYAPEGEAIPHGARLLFSTWAGANPDEWAPLYAIEAAP